MSDRIIREDFAPDKHITAFQKFDCGDHDYQRSVANWIKGMDPEDSVLTDVARRGTQVWVYYNQADELVGFGSLGTHEWSLPPHGKKKVPVVIIPNVAVARRFWGKPADDPFADQIPDDLRNEAQRYRPTPQALVLCVHPLNQRALRFYERHHFVVIEPPLKDGHLCMATSLAAVPPNSLD